MFAGSYLYSQKITLPLLKLFTDTFEIPFNQVSNDPRGIFQHSNLDMKQKGIKWSCIQIEPVLGQKTNSLL